MVLPFWYRLTQVVLEKRPLNGCNVGLVVVVVVVVVISRLTAKSRDQPRGTLRSAIEYGLPVYGALKVTLIFECVGDISPKKTSSAVRFLFEGDPVSPSNTARAMSCAFGRSAPDGA